MSVRLSPLALLLLVACADAERPATPPLPVSPLDSVGTALADAAAGQVVYVPAYSHVYSGDRQRPVNLAGTLSIRNTEPVASLRLVSVGYYDSGGRRVRSYLDGPRTLGPLSSNDFVVDESDTSGGSGASFLVEWTAEAGISRPVVEAVMISTASQQGISLVTEGRVTAEVDSP